MFDASCVNPHPTSTRGLNLEKTGSDRRRAPKTSFLTAGPVTPAYGFMDLVSARLLASTDISSNLRLYADLSLCRYSVKTAGSVGIGRTRAE